jgi:hypothetical protein
MRLLGKEADHKIQELRYHGFFIGSAAFALVYDMLHDEEMARIHLPRVNMGLKYLYSMREGEPIASTIRAIESAVRKLGLEFTGQKNMCNPANDTVDSELIPESTGSTGIEEQSCDAQDSTQMIYLPVPTSSQISGIATPFPPQAFTMTPSGQAGRDGMGLWELGWNIDPSTVNMEEIFAWPTYDPLN